MIDEIFQKRPKKHVRDLNIVPIIDMLVTVIFFLLMSTSFIEYTKLTLPPSVTVTAPVESKKLPLLPKLVVRSGANGYEVHLSWQGSEPGHDSVDCNQSDIIPRVEAMLKKFKERHADERTLQISMERSVKYQTLISVMDASKDLIPDVVLLSYNEVNAP